MLSPINMFLHGSSNFLGKCFFLSLAVCGIEVDKVPHICWMFVLDEPRLVLRTAGDLAERVLLNKYIWIFFRKYFWSQNNSRVYTKSLPGNYRYFWMLIEEKFHVYTAPSRHLESAVVIMPGHYVALWLQHVIERTCALDPYHPPCSKW